jgi:nucleoside-diphosphate-sugar epimerase
MIVAMALARPPDLPPESEAALDEYLSRPTAATTSVLADLDGDVLILGAGGKLGLSLARMARRGLDEAGKADTHVTAVSRFGNASTLARFHASALDTLSCDLLADGALEALPDAANVVYLVGMKFGSTSDPGLTWAMNAYLPGLVARRFKRSRIVALSTGNVYPLVDVRSGGALESDPPLPVGEYAQSCLGRERLFTYSSCRDGTPVTLVRLNYANDLRYGVLVDIALRVARGEPVDVTTSHVNVIWQADANAAILQSFQLCASPPAVLNVSGPETASVRWLAGRLAELLGAPPPSFSGRQSDIALLSNCSRQFALFGYPRMPLGLLLEWTAAWIKNGGPLLNKPTGFQSRDGVF